MQFVSSEDLKRAYNGTYVSYKGSVYSVLVDGMTLLLYSIERQEVVSIDARKEFFFDPIELGYWPDFYTEMGKYLVHSTRMPLRQWQQGLSNKTLASYIHSVDPAVGVIDTTNISVRVDSTYIKKMLKKAYAPFSVVVANGGGGLSKDYGLTANNYVLFNGAVIGKWSTKGIGLVGKHYYNSIIRQDLEDVLAVPRIWKQDEEEQKNGMDF